MEGIKGFKRAKKSWVCVFGVLGMRRWEFIGRAGQEAEVEGTYYYIGGFEVGFGAQLP